MTEHEGTATEATAEEATAEESADQPAEANAEAAESPQSNRVSNREARYRLRLREAEAQRDALQERVTGMQRQAAESIAGETLRKAAAIWAVAGLPDLLAPDGALHFVGVPAGKLKLPLTPLLTKRLRVMGSPIGGRGEIAKMLEIADTFGIEPVVETFALSEVNEALQRVRENSVRYRAVLFP